MSIPAADLPTEARAALEAGEAWSYEPEGVASDGLEWPHQSSTGWYRTWTFVGIEVEPGEFPGVPGRAYYTKWILDECGDWNCNGETDGDDLDANAEAWAGYAAFVYDTGTDPLRNYYVKREVKRTEVWQFRAAESIPGMVLQGVRRNGRGPVLLGSDIPEHVRTYLALRRVTEGVDYVADFKSCEDTFDRAKKVQWQRSGRGGVVLGKFTLDRKVPRSVHAITRDLRTAAKRGS